MYTVIEHHNYMFIVAALFCRQISYPTSTFVCAFPKYRHLLVDAREVVPWRSRTRENSKLFSRENLISSSYPACRYICSKILKSIMIFVDML